MLEHGRGVSEAIFCLKAIGVMRRPTSWPFEKLLLRVARQLL
jgi:hypothetical protein